MLSTPGYVWSENAIVEKVDLERAIQELDEHEDRGEMITALEASHVDAIKAKDEEIATLRAELDR